MLKRLILGIALLGCTPALASAWTITEKIGSGQGTIASGAQTVTSGTGYLAVPNGTASQDVTITAAAGYALSLVVLDGVNVTHPDSDVYTVTSPYNKNHNLFAYFTPTTYQVGVTQGAGGMISVQQIDPVPGAISITGLTSLHNGAKVRVTVSPNTDMMVTDLTVGGVKILTGGTSQTPYSYTFTLSGQNSSPSVSAGFAQVPRIKAAVKVDKTVAATASPVQLDATGTATNVPVTYSYSVSAGDASKVQITGTPGASNATFTASAAGTYTVTVTATGGGTTSTVATPTLTILAAGLFGSQQCVSCHSGRNQQLVASYLASPHAATAEGPNCASCHNPANSGHYSNAQPVDSCNGCHVKSGAVAGHPFDMGTSICVGCHDPHTTVGTITANPTAAHFNNLTGAHYPASYVTSKATCADCHYAAGADNREIRSEWAISGHGATTDNPFTEYDFKTKTGCVQCHTTTGFIAFSSAKVSTAWGTSSDKTKEVITCVACHSDITTGTVRSVAAVKPFADDSYQNRNVGESNVCMNCHSGRNNGQSILVKVGTTDFTNTSFVSPHYLAAGGVLHGRGAYNFPGQAYAFYSTNSHRTIGIGNVAGTGSAGPCVTCHASSPKKHLFGVLSSANGAAAGITSSACAKCHGSSLAASDVADAQGGYDTGLTILKAMLADRGFVYSPSYPYFANTNWGRDQAGANIMGAAFNYVLLSSEPGAYAHNAGYAKKLITDSIDAAYNGGTVTGSIDGALSYLVGKNAITSDAADQFTSYKKSSMCTKCHTATSGSHLAHLAVPVGCETCHSTTAASSTSLVAGSTTHANGVVDVALAAKVGGSYSGGLTGTCSNVYCHSDGNGVYQSMTWVGGKLNCKSCHPTLSGSHSVHIGDLWDSGKVTFYNYTANTSTDAMYRFGCANCHPTDPASHMNGTIDVTLALDPAAGSLRAKSGAQIGGIGNSGSGVSGTSKVSVTCSAAYCHSNGYAAAPVFATTPDWYGGSFAGDRCAACHGNSPGTTVPGSSAHKVHVIGIHALRLFNGTLGKLPAGASGSVGHGIAAQSTTINCNTCHAATVNGSRNDLNTACVSCHNGQGNTLQIVSRAHHVNGVVEISFVDGNIVSKAQVRPASFAAYTGIWARNRGVFKNSTSAYDVSRQTLRSAAAYDGSGGCSNVACHLGHSVKWSDKPLSYCSICHTAL